MGLLDKMKEQATNAGAAAKDAAQRGQAKLDEMQGKREADSILRDLGATIYAERSGRATANTASDADRLVSLLQEHEKEHGPVSLVLEHDTPAQTA